MGIITLENHGTKRQHPVLSFQYKERGYFATLRGDSRIGGVILRSSVKGPLKWWWSIGDGEIFGFFVEGWCATLREAQRQSEDAGIMFLQGIDPRNGMPFTHQACADARPVENQ